MTDATLPAPLLPPHVDLSDFGFMPLDVRRLRDSRTAAAATGEEFRAAVLLWCAAWHQVPAASIPDDDIELAQLAGFGRVIAEWRKVKDGALRGWVKCSDGRLYHPVVAEKAAEAWNGKLDHAWRRDCDRARKENQRRASATPPEEPLPLPPKPPRVSVALGPGTDASSDGKPALSAGNGALSDGKREPSAGFPAENALKGQGEGEGEGEGQDIILGAASPHTSAEEDGEDPPTLIPKRPEQLPLGDRANGFGANGHKSAARRNGHNGSVHAGNDGFDRFWRIYPSRGDATNPKKPAREKFAKLVARGVDPEQIVAGTEGYRAAMRKQGQDGTRFVAQAITFLNQETWEQYLPRPGAARPVASPTEAGKDPYDE
jgi:hypothetical protein